MQAVCYHISAWRWIACRLLARFSPNVHVSRVSSLRLREIPEPALPGPDWVRLKTIYGGVCGTDLSLITSKGHPNTILKQYAAFPAVLGHENVAVVAEVGDNVRDWKIGDRICADPALGCRGRGINPPCRFCAAGQESICEGTIPVGRVTDPTFTPDATGGLPPSAERRNATDPWPNLPPRALLGLNRTTLGSWSPQFLAHASQLHKIPDDVTNEQAILVDPIASASHAVLHRPPETDEHILIQGAGIVSLGVVAAIRAIDCPNPITTIVRNQFQADLARTMGATNAIIAPRKQHRRDTYDAVAAETGAHRVEGSMGNQSLIGGYDLVYDCSGTGQGLSDALKLTRSRGTTVVVGTTGIAMTDTTPIWFTELNVVGASGRQIETINGERKHTYDVVFDWLRSGKLDLSHLPTACVPLSDYRKGLAMLINRPRPNIVKVYFRPND